MKNKKIKNEVLLAYYYKYSQTCELQKEMNCFSFYEQNKYNHVITSITITINETAQTI